MTLSFSAHRVIFSNPETVFDHVQVPVLMIRSRYSRQLAGNYERNKEGTVNHRTLG